MHLLEVGKLLKASADLLRRGIEHMRPHPWILETKEADRSNTTQRLERLGHGIRAH